MKNPPKNTFFFIGNTIPKKIHVTLLSRCLIYKIIQPTEEIGLQWIQKNLSVTKKSSLIAIRLSENNPISAKKMLTYNIWNKRKILYNQIYSSIQNKKFIKLLPILKYYTILQIDWIILILLDSIKSKTQFSFLIINSDQKLLINEIIKNYSYKDLNYLIKSWIKCRYQLTNIKNINFELLILKQLLSMEKIF